MQNINSYHQPIDNELMTNDRKYRINYNLSQ